MRDAFRMTMERLAGRPESSFRHQMMLAYFSGYAWARWHERRAGTGPRDRNTLLNLIDLEGGQDRTVIGRHVAGRVARVIHLR